MSPFFKNLLPLLFLSALAGGCQSPAGSGQMKSDSHEPHPDAKQGHHAAMALVISSQKFADLGLKADSLPRKNLKAMVQANGHLRVPPQHEAAVTAVLGGNVTAIKVIEGDPVRKGQALAYLAHPDLSNLQARYVKAYHQEKYLAQKYQRQKKLFQEEVTSGEQLQAVRADYQAVRAKAQALAAQLRQLHLDVSRIRKGQLYGQVPVISPIQGYVEKVRVKLGQYVAPTTEMFLVVNTEHVHADLMVFESDVHKVKVDQLVQFRLKNGGRETHQARIYSVGQKFEQDPKALHVHAELLKKDHRHIPGMYIQGQILTGSQQVLALPEEALVEEAGKTYAFTARRPAEQDKWHLEAVEMKTGAQYDGWTEVQALKPQPPGTQYLWNGAYTIISEIQKSQASHGH